MIDDHPLEKKAMALFKNGDHAKARQLQAKFLEEVKDSVEDHCNCPIACKYHGSCIECVILHRGHGDHLPHCFHRMINKRIETISELTEHSFKSPSVDA